MGVQGTPNQNIQGQHFDYRAQALHQEAVKAVISAGSAQAGAEMDVSQQAEAVKYPTESQRSHLIRGNLAQWCVRLPRFSHVAIKNDLGRQIAERAEAAGNEGITSGQDCSSLMLGGSTRQAQDFPAGPSCQTVTLPSHCQTHLEPQFPELWGKVHREPQKTGFAAVL